MRKINKITNIALMFTIIGVFLFQDTGYALHALRVPNMSQSRQERAEEQMMIDETKRIAVSLIEHELRNKINSTSIYIQLIERYLKAEKWDDKILNQLTLTRDNWLLYTNTIFTEPLVFNLQLFCNSMEDNIGQTQALLEDILVEALKKEKNMEEFSAKNLIMKNTKSAEECLLNLSLFKEALLKLRESCSMREIIKTLEGMNPYCKLDLCSDELIFDKTMELEPLMIFAILANFINNARDASSGKDCGTLRVSKKSNKIIMQFSDKGSGMAKKILQRIGTEGFSTKDSRRNAGEKGRGIWLTLEYLKRKGGTMQIDSKSKRGHAWRLVFDKKMEKRQILESDKDDVGTAITIILPILSRSQIWQKGFKDILNKCVPTCVAL
jgi:signal transduction histidine kinase